METSLSQLAALDSLPGELSRVIHHAQTVATAAEMDAALDRLAVRLTALGQDRDPVLLTLLPGGAYLAGALLRRVVFPLQTAYILDVPERMPSKPRELLSVLPDVAGRLIILVDDGLTDKPSIDRLGSYLEEGGAAEGWRCSLVAQSAQSSATAGFFSSHISAVVGEGHGLFGCGLDVQGYCRNLPSLHRG